MLGLPRKSLSIICKKRQIIQILFVYKAKIRHVLRSYIGVVYRNLADKIVKDVKTCDYFNCFLNTRKRNIKILNTMFYCVIIIF